MTGSLRIIRNRRMDPVWNMAVDEVLAEAQRTPSAAPTLRFYSWERPAVTIGYFQSTVTAAKVFDADRLGLDVVRRLTGGGAVLHGEDLTFSLTLKVPNPYFPPNVKDSYLKINEVVRLALKPFYPLMDYADCRTVSSQTARQKERICFDAPSCYDLLLEGKKVLGASQRRLGEVFLHQSSLMLPDPDGAIERSLIDGFCGKWRLKAVEEDLTEEEIRSAGRVIERRYASDEWFRHAKAGVSP